MTPHNQAKPGDIAKFVLMPGDPLRAKFTAERYLENPVCFNTVRNMLGYTGTYQGKPVSVMGSGMGMPSMGIYSQELYQFYGVETIVRIGSAGGLSPKVHMRDVVLGMAACTDSNFAAQYHLPGTFAPIADFDLLEKAVQAAKAMQVPYHVGNLISSDHFYCADENSSLQWRDMGVLAVEMEAAALYMIAAQLGKKALAMATVSDLPLTGESADSTARQNSFTQMMEIALQLA